MRVPRPSGQTGGGGTGNPASADTGGNPMATLDTLMATLRADAREDQRKLNRMLGGSVADGNVPGEWSGYFVPMGADLTADRALLGEVWDNAPEVWGAPSAADYTGNGWEPVSGGRKRTVLPFA